MPTGRELFARCQCAVVRVRPIKRSPRPRPPIPRQVRRRSGTILPHVADVDVLPSHRHASAYFLRAAVAGRSSWERGCIARAAARARGVGGGRVFWWLKKNRKTGGGGGGEGVSRPR